jgi:phytoene dehydrogenase-like protein
LGEFVGDQYNRQVHADSVVGCNRGVDVTIVGSGPNGLAAAVICARAGLKVQVIEAQPTFGGGARSAADFEFPGVLHDVCSAVHPLALASPFFAEFGLAARGVRLAVPEIAYANPLPGRPAAIAYRDLDRTCAELDDGASWRRFIGPLAAHSDAVVAFLLGDKRSVPRALPSVVRLGLRMLAQGTPAWGTLAGDDARALFTGVAAHAITPLPSLASAGAGLMLATLAHAIGWPIPVGGTQAISDALIADLRAHGGELTAGVEVTEPPSGVAVFDTAPTALLPIYGDALPSRYANALRRYRFGPGAAKVDFVLSDDIPWSDPRLNEAPTLHLGGTREQMARAEADIAAGRHAEHPMVLGSLPHAADPSRVDGQGRRPFWTYAHVPAGSTLDATEAVTGVVEGFAPGFRDVVVAARAVPAARMADHNANYVGGDISVGGNSTWRALAGPTPQLNPWRTPVPKVYLCSAATPPGAGVHGMAGYYAARSVLRREFGIGEMPKLALG